MYFILRIGDLRIGRIGVLISVKVSVLVGVKLLNPEITTDGYDVVWV